MSDNGTHCLVFSKDRAMQLDAFLRSAEMYAPYVSVTVAQHPEPLEPIVRAFLDEHERVVFHTDDDVWFREPPLLEITPDTTISYRLGSNTYYCHPLQREQAIPESMWCWRWRDYPGSDFGYPLSLNGTVYRSADLLPLLDFPFRNPNELEAGLAARTDRFEPEWMTAPLHSCVVSLPHNVTSTSSGNPRGSNPNWQPGALRDLYMYGWRIDLDAMDFTHVTAAHQEIPLRFHRP